jgi:hypothetical protein
MALSWIFSEWATNRIMTRVDQKKSLLSRYKYPFGVYEATQHEDTLLKGNRKKVEQ